MPLGPRRQWMLWRLANWALLLMGRSVAHMPQPFVDGAQAADKGRQKGAHIKLGVDKRGQLLCPRASPRGWWRSWLHAWRCEGRCRGFKVAHGATTMFIMSASVATKCFLPDVSYTQTKISSLFLFVLHCLRLLVNNKCIGGKCKPLVTSETWKHGENTLDCWSYIKILHCFYWIEKYVEGLIKRV